MARFNEILVGRYNRFLQKLMGMKGGPPAPQLASEITAALTLFNGAENRYLEGWQRYCLAVQTGTAAAGNRAAWRIRNPAGSNVVAVIEKIVALAIVATDQPLIFFNGIATTMPTENVSNISGVQLDIRGGQTGSTCILSTSVNFGLLGSNPIMQAQIAVGTQYDFLITDVHELPLAPGSEYTLEMNTLANNVGVVCMWRERLIEESERT